MKNDDTMYNTIFLQEDSVSNQPNHISSELKMEKLLNNFSLLETGHIWPIHNLMKETKSILDNNHMIIFIKY